MARAPNERPSRRLDAILETIRKHDVVEFEAGELEGVGKGLKFRFQPSASSEEAREVTRKQVGTMSPLGRDVEDDRPQPRDELDIVIEAREGPIPS